jgi:hypothetical protein
LRVLPTVDFLPRLVFGVAIAFLELAFQLITLAIDRGYVVIGELAPALLIEPLATAIRADIGRIAESIRARNSA